MPSPSRSPSPIEARTLGAARAWVAASIVLLLASCFDSKRIIFLSEEATGGQDAAAADVAVSELTPADDATGAGLETPAGEDVTGPNDALSAEPAAPGSAVEDAGISPSIDAG